MNSLGTNVYAFKAPVTAMGPFGSDRVLKCDIYRAVLYTLLYTIHASL